VSLLGPSEGEVATVGWIHDQGPDPVPADVLDRIMYLGVPSTGPDGAHFPPPRDGPQAYLAVQGAQVDEIPTHFHSVEQFQYVVIGSGTIGDRTVEAGVVHYADRFTPYGPLCAGPLGMTYATLRPCHDTGVFVMPAGQDRLAALLRSSMRPAGDRRQHTVDLKEPVETTGETGRSEWIDLQRSADGFRIAVTAVPPLAAAPPVVVGGSGAYLLVVGGAIDDDGGPYGSGSIAWRAAGDSVRSQAAERGARLALLQFPGVPGAPAA
jgi:hypothetical protein